MSTDAPKNANESCVGPTSVDAGKASGCAGCPNQSLCSSGAFNQRDPDLDVIQARLSGVKHKVLVLSGKGGVGKSTLTKELGLALGRAGYTVGIVDLDICGPSIPRMTGCLDESIHSSSDGWEPVAISDNVVIMSIQLLLANKDDAIVWRGPKKNKMIKDFLKNVNWGPLDVLLFDTPPGTSDEHISIVNILKDSTGVDGAVLVTTPQELSVADVRRELTFCNKSSLKILGIIENMTAFVCPGCKCTSDVFPRIQQGADEGGLSGADILAKEFEVPVIGRIPFDHYMMQSCEAGMSVAEAQPDSHSLPPINEVMSAVVHQLEMRTPH